MSARNEIPIDLTGFATCPLLAQIEDVRVRLASLDAATTPHWLELLPPTLTNVNKGIARADVRPWPPVKSYVPRKYSLAILNAVRNAQGTLTEIADRYHMSVAYACKIRQRKAA